MGGGYLDNLLNLGPNCTGRFFLYVAVTILESHLQYWLSYIEVGGEGEVVEGKDTHKVCSRILLVGLPWQSSSG